MGFALGSEGFAFGSAGLGYRRVNPKLLCFVWFCVRLVEILIISLCLSCAAARVTGWRWRWSSSERVRPLVGISRSQKTGTVATRNSKNCGKKKKLFLCLVGREASRWRGSVGVL
jgi:hypothetical protein